MTGFRRLASTGWGGCRIAHETNSPPFDMVASSIAHEGVLQGYRRAVLSCCCRVKSIEDELRQKLGTKVEIKQSARDKGQFVLRFESNDDFERILEALRR